MSLILWTFFIDCPSNTTVLPTLAATRPHQNTPPIENKLENRSFHMDGFLRHLTSSQFHSYSAALAITIGVGCFLLLLNILIFAGIYYQRVKRTLDTKKKEEYVESDIILPNFIDRCIEKGVEKGSLDMPAYSADLSYNEYSRYVEKAMHCGQPTETHKCKASGKDTHVDFIRIPINQSHNIEMPDKKVHISINDTTIHQRLSTYPSPQLHSSLSEADSSTSNSDVTYQGQQSINRECLESQKTMTEHCNQSTQSDFLSMHDVGTTVTESDVEDRHTSRADDIRTEKVLSTPSSLRSSISTSNYQGGILRQHQLGPTTPSTSKKRVQIQEISV